MYLFNFEMKRMLRGKDWIGMILGMIVMIIAAIINSVVVQPMFEGTKSIRYDFYCGVSQLMPFVFAPSMGNFFTKDYEENSEWFYTNLRIKSIYALVIRIGVILIYGCSIIFLGSFIYLIVENASIMESMEIFLIIGLQFMYLTGLIAMIAYISRKKIVTIVFTIFGTMILSVINVMPLGVLQGKIFLMDGHSLITDNVYRFVVEGSRKYFSMNVVILLGWICVVYMLYLGIIMNNKKRRV